MDAVLRFPAAVRRDPAIDVWLDGHWNALGALARHWFERMRACGDDVRELMHDGHPVSCVGDAAFAYVAVFSAHANVGFFRGAELPDPDRLLQGTGRHMRHVKLGTGRAPDNAALESLLLAAYADMRARKRLPGSE